MLPNDLPPWEAVYQQTRCWVQMGVLETLASDLRAMLRMRAGRAAQTSAAGIDSRTLHSSVESGE